jgi:hypothetical protein
MIKNAATGKCLAGSNTTSPEAAAMVTCNPNSSYQRWTYTSGHIELVFQSWPVGVCVGVQKSPSGSYARQVVTVACNSTTYGMAFFGSFSSTVKSPIGSSNPVCYLGDYVNSSARTYPSCYVSSGNNTQWYWVR